MPVKLAAIFVIKIFKLKINFDASSLEHYAENILARTAVSPPPLSLSHGANSSFWFWPFSLFSYYRNDPEDPSSPTGPGGVIGSQEFYRDHYKARADAMAANNARSKRQMESQVESMSFSEKMRLFAQKAGDGNPPAIGEKIKASSAQRLLEQR